MGNESWWTRNNIQHSEKDKRERERRKAGEGREGEIKQKLKQKHQSGFIWEQNQVKQFGIGIAEA